MNDDLITKVESLKAILASRATGEPADDGRYQNIRRELVVIPRIEKLLPRCVRSCRNLPEFWSFIQPKFKSYAERRGYLRDEFEQLLNLLETEPHIPSDTAISATVHAVSSNYIREAWEKALQRRATDPEGAITASRSLLEAVCKHILDNAAVAYDDGAEMPKLYAITAKQLNLSPSQHTEQLFKHILGNCQMVVEGIGALRNRHSDAHGKSATAVKPAPRHAELAVNLAGTMATFLLQTWDARKKTSAPN
jgi:hypothetical protein